MTDHWDAVSRDYGDRLRAGYDKIRAAFESVGVTLRPLAGARLAYWINGTLHDEDRYQDARSRVLVEAVIHKGMEFRSALVEAWQHSGFADRSEDSPNDGGEKINLCESLFSEDAEADCIWSVMAIEMQAVMCLERGRKKNGAGRPAHYAYYRFIRQLNELYFDHVGSRGFVDKNGTAEGPFIDVVLQAQTVLPDAFRIPAPTRARIGSRILRAFETNFEEPALRRLSREEAEILRLPGI